MKKLLICVLLASASAFAQTEILGDRAMKGKWDASASPQTIPFQTGLASAIPGTCTVGQIYFATDGINGRNIMKCATTNTWTTIVYDQGTSVPGSCVSGQIFFKTDATAGTNLYLCNLSSTYTQMVTSGSSTKYALILTATNGTSGVETYPDSSSITWTCSGSTCTGNWTVPTGLNWITVEAWSGGSGSGGSTANTGSNAAGSGGGYYRGMCQVTPGASLALTLGLGGTAGANYSGTATAGGNTVIGTCVTILGAEAAITAGTVHGWAGRIGSKTAAVLIPATGLIVLSTTTACTGTAAAGSEPIRNDSGSCGAGANATTASDGKTGGGAIYGGGGGGGGSYNTATSVAGGVSLFGGAGGVGGGYTVGGGLVACGNGVVPGGGGGSPGAEPSAGANHAGCNGARGEIRIYY